MAKFFGRLLVVVATVAVCATTAVAQEPLLGTAVGDQFMFSWNDLVDGKSDAGHYTLTSVGREGEYYAYKGDGRKALITEDGQARQTRGSYSDSAIYSPHKGLRPPGGMAGQSWIHNHRGSDGEGQRYMECTSRVGGPFQVGGIRFEKTVVSECVDKRAVARYPQNHEVVWAKGVPFPLHTRAYWNGASVGERITKMERMVLQAYPATSLLMK